MPQGVGCFHELAAARELLHAGSENREERHSWQTVIVVTVHQRVARLRPQQHFRN